MSILYIVTELGNCMNYAKYFFKYSSDTMKETALPVLQK